MRDPVKCSGERRREIIQVDVRIKTARRDASDPCPHSVTAGVKCRDHNVRDGLKSFVKRHTDNALRGTVCIFLGAGNPSNVLLLMLML